MPEKPSKPQTSLISVMLASLLVGSAGGAVAGGFVVASLIQVPPIETGLRAQQGAGQSGDVVGVVAKASPAVVSIIISKDLPKISANTLPPEFNDPFFRQFFGQDFGQQVVPNDQGSGEKQEIGGGSGFIVSPDGYIVTNKHVVFDKDASYTVLLNDERKFDAKVLAVDPTNDLAILKIDAKDLPTLRLGDSDTVRLGQPVIAIGNALGEFRNTVSTGVISGLSRSITAGGEGFEEQLSGVIQTDASINPGNSGGPLLNLNGEVIGINTAVASAAQNIAFTIPINDVKEAVESVKQNGKIVRAFLGVRYIMLNEDIAKQNNLKVSAGALVSRGEQATELAVTPGSPAEKAGLVENDIIVEVDGEKVSEKNPLHKLISRHKPGDTITLKILHKGDEKSVPVTLTEVNP